MSFSVRNFSENFTVLTFVISIIIIVLLIVLFGRVDIFILVSVYCVLLRFIKFMSRCSGSIGDCAFSASFVRESPGVTGVPNVNFLKISVRETI